MKKAFAVAAHPDDIEFIMSGTLMRLAAVGYELHYMNVADGCCGSLQHDRETTARIRLEEAKQAAAQIGAIFHPPITHDLEIFYEHSLLVRLGAVMREVSPDIILTHSLSDYMEDHMNAARLAVTAAFARGAKNYPVDPPTMTTATDVTIYHAQPHGNIDPLGEKVCPTHFVDVGDLLPKKRDMLSCHESQKQWLDETQKMDSYLKSMEGLLAEVGQMSGQFTHAEGWRRHAHMGFCGADDDPLKADLQAVCSISPRRGKGE